MEDDKSVDTNLTEHMPTRKDLEIQKSIVDQVGRNLKDLELFLNYNQKLRSSIIELSQAYLSNNEESIKKIK
jgi:hypothetical protein